MIFCCKILEKIVMYFVKISSTFRVNLSNKRYRPRCGFPAAILDYVPLCNY